MRRTPLRLLVPLIAVAAVSITLAGCDNGAPEWTLPSSDHAGELSGVTTTEELVQLCQSTYGLDANGSTVIDHDAWGPTTVVACGPMLSLTSVETVGILAVDQDGAVVWSQTFSDVYYELMMAEPGTDTTGNVFVMYNPGRYDGLIVLRPTPTDIELLIGPDSTEGSAVTPIDFFGVDLNLVSGQYEITKLDGVTASQNTPSTASPSPSTASPGKASPSPTTSPSATSPSTTTTYTWDGTTYVAQ